MTGKTKKDSRLLDIVTFISLLVGVIYFLGSFGKEYITHQSVSINYSIFFILLSILFQIMKLVAKEK